MKTSLHLEFDNQNRRDVALFEKISQLLKEQLDLYTQISSPRQSVPTYSSSQIEELIKENAQYKTTKRELEEDIKRFRKEMHKNQEVIQSKESIIDKLTKENESLKTQLNNAENRIKKSEEEALKFLDEEHSRYLELERNSGNEKERLMKEINILQKKIETYEPNTGSNSGENLFYNVDSNILTQTNDDKAPYIARVQSSDGKTYIFQFNKDKGPAVEACEKRESLILPFCEIIEEVPDGANSIGWGTWGTAKITNSGDLKIETKAQIKLIKI